MGEAAVQAKQAHDSEWLDHAVRVGLVAYGLVLLMVAWPAGQLALVDKSEDASHTGALHAIAEQPLGGVLSWMIALGLVLLVVWRLLESAFGVSDVDDDVKRWRKRLAALGKGSLYAAVAWSAIRTAVGDGSKGGTDSTTAKLMNLPGGQVIFGAVALAILAYGAMLVLRGWTEKLTQHLDAEGESGKDAGAAVRARDGHGHRLRLRLLRTLLLRPRPSPLALKGHP